ncbi:aminotransferase class V-fold PLP-dependent enzyme [candidate division KSB1 bacterium]|nr:aminotransferase class V-fold PLP-dependent enzyme [candidate division KSB1 bacterium]
MGYFENYRSLYPITKKFVHLNHAALAPMSTRVLKAIAEFIGHRSRDGEDRIEEHLGKMTYLRGLLGKLINAPGDRIGLVKNTSEGLNILASGLQWQPDDRILLNDLEFPANVFPFLNLKRRGVKIDFVKNRDGKILVEDLDRAVKPKTRLLCLSFVQFLNGFKADLEAIGRWCRRKGIIFCVDAIQGLGALPVDVQKASVDFLACGGHKWLMAPQGTGFVYVTEELQDQIYQAHLGWLSMKDPANFFNYNVDLLGSAQRYEIGSYNFMGFLGMIEAIKLLLGVGIENIKKRIMDLTDLLIAELQESGISVLTPLEPDCRSGIVFFGAVNPGDLYKKLSSQKIIVSHRGTGIRVSPHFYNTEDEILRLVDCVRDKS